MNNNDNKILSHTTWNCKYHIVFAPKYRRKIFYESHRKEIMNIIKELCRWKGVEIIEGEMAIGSAKFQYRCREFWCRGYYVDTTGKNTEVIKKYIQNQLKQDKETMQLSIDYPEDPFKGSK